MTTTHLDDPPVSVARHGDPRPGRPSRTRRLLGAAAAVAMVVVAGCGGGGGGGTDAVDAIAEQAVGGDVDFDSESGSISFETEDGSSSFGQDMPDNWPDDIPLPDDFRVSMGGSADTDADVTVTVQGTTADSPEDVVDLYTSTLSGWVQEESETMSLDGSAYIQVLLRDGDRTLMVTATEAGGAAGTAEADLTLVGVTYMEESNQP